MVEEIYALLAFIGGLSGAFLSSYFKEKGKNVATKEDISHITKEIEKVKYEYTRETESLRSNLSNQIKVSGFRYEKEYEILSDLTDKLVDVRDSALSMRPELDYIDPKKDPQEITNERLDRFQKSHYALYLSREKTRPFYSQEIYAAILAVESAARLESIQFQYRNPYEDHYKQDYWDQAVKNQKEIANAATAALDAIRTRVEKWERIS
ncbi:hypothetical protein [Teredinibacter turnerae]|uniref:hypothetical protein n=1 Tax=Teredinibacter turnerae TaxID=2426 RepID=UPI00037B2BF7|nr:hypothetical protein [Teredinibacter turnerae]